LKIISNQTISIKFKKSWMQKNNINVNMVDKQVIPILKTIENPLTILFTVLKQINVIRI
tara:strand:+ start:9986 stop:10162 length:177 start_codon:yes stop_codon:yes gene_type:complete